MELYCPPDKLNSTIKQVKIEPDNCGDNYILNNTWYVWKHSNTGTDWTIDSYSNIFKINSIGAFWKFFNNFNMLDKISYQFFIMREGIEPIWENVHNRNGGICSIKIDYFNNRNRNELGSEIMICICLLILNETLLINNMIINGISYAIKNRSILIKIWINNYNNNKNINDLLPVSFLRKIDKIIRSCEKTGYRPNSISIQYKKIIQDSNES